MNRQPSEEAWQVRLFGSRLPWNAGPIRPADVGDGLCSMMLARENLLEDANYQKIAPNRSIVEINQELYEHNYRPLEAQIITQWNERLLQHLLTANSRQGRMEYRLAGAVKIEIRPVSGLRNDQARVLSRVQPEQPGKKREDQLQLPACLEDIHGGQRWELRSGLLTVGREASCTIHLNAPAIQLKRLVSSQHAYLYCQAGSYRLYDGAPDGKPSLNGTFVNMQRVLPGGVELQDGDLILLAAVDPQRPDPDAPGVAALRFQLDCT